MSEQNAVQNMAQKNAALRPRVAILEEELAFAQDQLSWLKNRYSDAELNRPPLS